MNKYVTAKVVCKWDICSYTHGDGMAYHKISRCVVAAWSDLQSCKGW